MSCTNYCEGTMISLLLFISLVILFVVVFIALKLIDMDRQMSTPRHNDNDVTQEIPVRRRSEF